MFGSTHCRRIRTRQRIDSWIRAVDTVYITLTAEVSHFSEFRKDNDLYLKIKLLDERLTQAISWLTLQLS
jgi:hypothetical protein